MDELDAILAKHKIAPVAPDAILTHNGVGSATPPVDRMAAARAKLAAQGASFAQTKRGATKTYIDKSGMGDTQSAPQRGDTAIPVGASQGDLRPRLGLTSSAAVQALAGLPDSVTNLPSTAANLGFALGGLGQMPFMTDAEIARMQPQLVPDVAPVSALAANTVKYREPQTAAERAYAQAVKGGVTSVALKAGGIQALLAGLGMAAGSGAKDLVGDKTIGASVLGNILDSALAYGTPAAATAVGHVAPKVYQGGKELMGVFSEAGRERKVFQPIADEVANAVVDKQALLNDLRNPARDVPGASPLSASILAEHGAPSEQGRVASSLATPSNAANTIRSHLDANAAARGAATEQAAPGTGGAANVQRRMEALVAQAKQRYDAAVAAAENAKAAAVSGAQAQRQAQQDALTTAAEAAKNSRTAAATGAVNAVGRDVSNTEAGAVLSAAADAAYQAEKAPYTGERTGMFAPEVVDPTGQGRILVSPGELQRRVADYYAGQTADIPPEIGQVLTSINRHVSSNRPPEPTPGLLDLSAMRGTSPRAPAVPDHLTYAQLKAVVENINSRIREARAASKDSVATGLTKLKSDLIDRVRSSAEAGQFPQDAAARYDAARAGYANLKERHGRYAANDITKVKKTGELVTSVADVPHAYFGRKPEDVQAFESTIGGNPQARQTGMDWLATQWRNAVMSPDRGGLKGGWRKANEAFMGREVNGQLVGAKSSYSDAINSFPELRSAMLDAARTARSAEEFAAIVDARLAQHVESLSKVEAASKVAASAAERSAKKSATQQLEGVKSSPAGFWFSPVDASVAFDRFIHSSNSLRDAQAMGALAQGHPQFGKDLKVALKEHLSSLKDDRARVDFLKSPQAKNLFDNLYGRGFGDALAKVARSAERDLGVTEATKTPFGVKVPESVLVRDALLMLTARTSTLAKWLGINALLHKPLKAGAAKVSEMHAKAHVDPAYMADMIEKRLPKDQPGAWASTAAARRATSIAVPQSIMDERRRKK